MGKRGGREEKRKMKSEKLVEARAEAPTLILPPSPPPPPFKDKQQGIVRGMYVYIHMYDYQKIYNVHICFNISTTIILITNMYMQERITYSINIYTKNY